MPEGPGQFHLYFQLTAVYYDTVNFLFQRLVLAVCLLCVPVASGRAGEDADRPSRADDAYTAGQQCFERLDFPCAIELFLAARSMVQTSQNRKVDIQRKLAESHLAMGEREHAVGDFVELLRLDPSYRIDAPGVSPKILNALQDARQRLQAPAAPALQFAPWMTLGLLVGAEFLVGEDQRLLEAGPLLDLACTIHLGGPWRLGGGLRYTRHEVAADAATVHLLGGWAGFGAVWKPGLVQLGCLVGLGVSRFGILDEEGKTGLLVPVRAWVDFPVLEEFHVGLVLAPAWLVTSDEDWKSSFTLTVGGRLAALF